MSSSLVGRAAIVTGASRGMGRRMAATLVEAGAVVGLLARPSEELAAAVAALGERAVHLPCDVADAEGVAAAVDRMVAVAGRLDILVNNAAMSGLHTIAQAAPEDLAREVAVNLLGPAYLIRAAAPHLKAAGGGDIVNVSSESVRHPFPYLSFYAATKAGLETLSAGVRVELRAQGTRVTVLRAGGVADSTMSRNWPPAMAQAFYAEIQASGHMAMTGGFVPPEDMAGMLLEILTLPRTINVDLIEARCA